jgi:hypothetical protein
MRQTLARVKKKLDSRARARVINDSLLFLARLNKLLHDRRTDRFILPLPVLCDVCHYGRVIRYSVWYPCGTE